MCTNGQRRLHTLSVQNSFRVGLASSKADGGRVLKDEMRVMMRARRAGCDPALGWRLAGHLLSWWTPQAGAVVAGFWPLAGEIDLRPLMLALMGRGHVVGLPATPAQGQKLVFRRWRAGTELISGRFGTRQAAGDLIVPDVLLVPMLAFDRAARRLGYGAGYYDRTLEGLPGARTIGCAFAVQEVAAVPVEPHDRRMDLIATEVGVFVPESLIVRHQARCATEPARHSSGNSRGR